MSGWRVETWRAPAGELHARRFPADGGRHLWILEPTAPAVVLGSTQSAGDIDAVAAAAAGVEIVRRRSGGGAVWVAPDEPVWIDVFLPRDDPAWSDDVGASFAPVGAAWRDALTALGIGDTVVHAGAMAHSPWSRTVCFAGLGPGEVVRPDAASPTGVAKIVGISQRRSRDGARFQCALPRRWDPAPLAALLTAPPPAGTLDAVGAGIGTVAVDALVDAFLAAFG